MHPEKKRPRPGTSGGPGRPRRAKCFLSPNFCHLVLAAAAGFSASTSVRMMLWFNGEVPGVLVVGGNNRKDTGGVVSDKERALEAIRKSVAQAAEERAGIQELLKKHGIETAEEEWERKEKWRKKVEARKAQQQPKNVGAKGGPEENANEKSLGGGAGPSGGGGGEKLIQAAAAEGGGSESSVSYALLYPNSDCSGETSIRINSTESERKCSNCRDLCNLRFPGDDKTANDRPAGSISIRFRGNGKHRLELHSRCVGTYDDEGRTVSMMHPSTASKEGCLAAVTPFDHVKFVPASAQ